ncbi:MAG: hypothetical protein M4579_003763 [Chaenotheca gracillima]|nr:MAG: hypothetical protein M4579_003763 [Chaenotheca gracillima]
MSKPTAASKVSHRSVRTVQLPRHRLRFLASILHSFYRPASKSPAPLDAVTVVCISDTHNTRPPLPPGDLLLHGGDLSNWGTFAEIQAQLTWLAEQSHKYKVVIAGNHDLLLDAEFRINHPDRCRQALNAAGGACHYEEEHKTADELDWGDVIYLENSATTLDFPNGRALKIYGSPLTPQYGISAFQYPSSMDPWTAQVPPDVDILLTHGPPRGHLDGIKKSGCALLAREVVRVKPRLVAYGHIHIGYGFEERVYDSVERAFESINGNWDAGSADGWAGLIKIAWFVLWSYLIPRRWPTAPRPTTFANAAVVKGWKDHVAVNEAVVTRV